MRWYFFRLPALCAVAALLDLDAYRVGQWMLSRPIVLGPLLGGCLGKFGVGTWVGGTLELLTLDDLPIGHCVPLNSAVAVASTLLLFAGKPRVELAAAFPAGLLLGLLFRQIEIALRSRCHYLVQEADLAIDRGRAPSGWLIARGICTHAAASACFLYVGIVVAGPVLASGWSFLPFKFRTALDLALQGAPWLGLTTLLYVFRLR